MESIGLYLTTSINSIGLAHRKMWSQGIWYNTPWHGWNMTIFLPQAPTSCQRMLRRWEFPSNCQGGPWIFWSWFVCLACRTDWTKGKHIRYATSWTSDEFRCPSKQMIVLWWQTLPSYLWRTFKGGVSINALDSTENFYFNVNIEFFLITYPKTLCCSVEYKTPR